jgi:hypothetical protein
MADIDDEIQARIDAAVADHYTAGEVDAYTDAAVWKVT